MTRRIRACATWIALILSLSLVVPAPGSASVPGRYWAHLTFDGAHDDLQPGNGMQVSRSSEVVASLDGRLGDALPLSREQSIAIDVLPGATPFPTMEGSIAVWIRPSRPLDDSSRWIVFGNWAQFDIHLQGAQLVAYATSDHRAHLNVSLAPLRNRWAGQWHLLVMTWSGRGRQIYVDGKLLGQRADAAPLTVPPQAIRFGYLPATQKEPDRGHFDGSIDEILILDVALSGSQVSRLFDAGTGDSARSMLAALGGDVAIGLPRRAWVRGETAPLVVTPHAEGHRMTVTVSPEGTSSASQLRIWSGPVRQQRLSLDTRDLRPGLYVLHADVTSKNGGTVTQSVHPESIRVLPTRAAEFPVGIDGLTRYPDETLRQAAEWGMSFVSSGTLPDTQLRLTLDRLAYHGLGFVPNLNIHHQKVMDLPGVGYFDADGKGTPLLADTVLQGLVLDGDASFSRFSASLGSPFSPAARDAMRQKLLRFLLAAGDHPGLLGVSFDDEYSFRIGTDKASGSRYYGDYSRHAQEFFRARSGRPPVFPPHAPAGTVFPDDHPYFAWRDVIGMPGDPTTAGLANSWADLARVVGEVRPDVLTTVWSGGEYGELDVVMDYAYPAIWEPRPHFVLGHGRLDFVLDRHLARQRVAEPKPTWALLGWWSHDLSGQPAWCVQDLRLNTALALAKGVKAINWHTTYPGPTSAGAGGSGLLSRGDLRAEVARLAGWLRNQGPMYAHLDRKRDGRIAVLLSDDDRVGKLQRENQPVQFHWFYAAIRLAGYPVDLVTDEQVKAGRLRDYDALVVADFDYASRSLWLAIERYALTPGKLVFVDKGTALRPKGAIPLPLDYGQRGDPHRPPLQSDVLPLEYMSWMARMLRVAFLPHLGPSPHRVSGSDYVAPFVLYAGEGRLLTVVNYHLGEAQAVRLQIGASQGNYVYDADSGALVAQAKATGGPLTWSTVVPIAGAARFLVLPRPMTRLSIKHEIDGDEFVVRAAMLDPGGRPLRFPFPMRLDMVNPEGRTIAAYETRGAVNAKSGQLELRIPRARLMDRAGRWTARVTDLISGMSGSDAAVLVVDQGAS